MTDNWLDEFRDLVKHPSTGEYTRDIRVASERPEFAPQPPLTGCTPGIEPFRAVSYQRTTDKKSG